MRANYRPGSLITQPPSRFSASCISFQVRWHLANCYRNQRARTEYHYQTLGLKRGCSRSQIRDAYWRLAKRYHPDSNPRADQEGIEIKTLNNAYEILSDPARRRAYDRELDEASRAAAPGGSARVVRNISQEIRIRIEDFLRGTAVDVNVNDPANPEGAETYRLTIPPGTAPGTRFRIPRTAASGGGV
ncbi:MAG TPA: DnaJ domain-containing protein, partial [Chthoniobacterales bacterium]